MSVGVCLACKRTGLELSACGRCRCAKYCSVECIRKDWPRHKLTCRSPDQAKELVNAALGAKLEKMIKALGGNIRVAHAWSVGNSVITVTVPETYAEFLSPVEKFVYIGQENVRMNEEKSQNITVRVILRDVTRDFTVAMTHDPRVIREKIAQPPTSDWLLLFK